MMFETSLVDESLALAETFGLRFDDVKRLVGNAIESSWADEGTRARLTAELTASG